ncbi:MAG: hypothetical protein K9G70_14865 [Prolixibacteraceae bacterium]|nr:hypothetical protein [Prolixibacteraceae bacterium]
METCLKEKNIRKRVEADKLKNALTSFSSDYTNRKAVEEMVKYAQRMRKEGHIGENQFNTLIHLFLANFVENELEYRINDFLNKRIEKLIQH